MVGNKPARRASLMPPNTEFPTVSSKIHPPSPADTQAKVQITDCPESDHVIRLSERDIWAFLDAIEHPRPLHPKLLAALDDYASRRDDQTGTVDWSPRPRSA